MTDADAPTTSSSRRSALLALLLLVPAPSIGVTMLLVVSPGAIGLAASLVAKIWQLGLPVLWVKWVDRARLDFGKPTRDGMGLAVASGVVIGAIIIAAYALFARHWIDVDAARQRIIDAGFGTMPAYLGIALFTALVNALLEEYIWRWFVFRKCEALLPKWRAVNLSAALFLLHHITPLVVYLEDWRPITLALVGIYIGGAVWSWFFLRYRSIWPGYVSHVIVDAAVLGIGWTIVFG